MQLDVGPTEEDNIMIGHASGEAANYAFKYNETITRWWQWKSEGGAHRANGIGFKTSQTVNGDTTTGEFARRASRVSDACFMGDFK